MTTAHSLLSNSFSLSIPPMLSLSSLFWALTQGPFHDQRLHQECLIYTIMVSFCEKQDVRPTRTRLILINSATILKSPVSLLWLITHLHSKFTTGKQHDSYNFCDNPRNYLPIVKWEGGIEILMT
jgi:hypothetical protein